MAQSDPAFNLQKFIISIVIVGLTLVLGIYINETLGSNLDAPNTPVTVVNESTYINRTGDTLSGANAFEFGNAVVITAINGSSGAIIQPGNYSLNPTTGVLINASAIAWNNVNITWSYTFTNSTVSSEAAADVVSALSTGTSWISILVVVGFATIILTMLTSGLGAAARNDNAVPYY